MGERESGDSMGCVSGSSRWDLLILALNSFSTLRAVDQGGTTLATAAV